MKIVHLCLSCFYIDDYSYQENMLPKYHVKQGHDVTVIASLVSFDSKGKACLLENESVVKSKDGFNVVRIDYKRPFYKFNKFVRFYKNTYSHLKNENPDVIFIHDFSFMDIGKIIKYVSKHKHVKIFVDCHTDYINSAQTWVSRNIFHHLIWRYYAKILSPYVEKFYGVTPLRCDFLRDAYKIDPDKVELLVMGVDDELLENKDRALIRRKYLTALEIDDSDFIIVTGGKIDEKKNIHLVMQAVNDLNQKNVKLIVFGTVAPEMRALFDSLIISKSIIYIGWLNSDTILDYLLFADLIVFPGTHSVLWEQAVGVGTPCVFKYWEGMTHVDVGGNCEFLYKDTIAEIKDLFNLILNEKDKYRQMKEVAVKRGLVSFSYSVISKRAIN
jgi:1,2-diacylglycerol 3-alpha-glucosyltransferase